MHTSLAPAPFTPAIAVTAAFPTAVFPLATPPRRLLPTSALPHIVPPAISPITLDPNVAWARSSTIRFDPERRRWDARLITDISARATRGDQASCQEASCNPASHMHLLSLSNPVEHVAYHAASRLSCRFSVAVRPIMRAIAQLLGPGTQTDEDAIQYFIQSSRKQGRQRKESQRAFGGVLGRLKKRSA